MADVRLDKATITKNRAALAAAKELATANTTARLDFLLLAQQLSPTQDAIVSGMEAQPVNEHHALTREDDLILKRMQQSKPKLLSLYEFNGIANRKLIGKRIERLISKGLAHRPEGPNKGATITECGSTLIKNRARK